MRDIHELSRTLIEMRVWHSKQAFTRSSNLGISRVRKLSSPGVPEAWSERPMERPGVEGLRVCKSPIICSREKTAKKRQ